MKLPRGGWPTKMTGRAQGQFRQEVTRKTLKRLKVSVVLGKVSTSDDSSMTKILAKMGFIEEQKNLSVFKLHT